MNHEQMWRLALRGGGVVVVDVANAFDGTPLAGCTTAEQTDYMRATARLHEGAAPATAEGRCDGNVDGDSVVGYVAAELLMRKFDVAEILPPGVPSRDELTAALATERERAEAATTRADALAAQLDGLREAAARVRAACAATKDAGAAFDRAGRTYAHTRSDDDGDAMERADAVCRAAWQERFAAEAALSTMLGGCL